MERQAPVIVFAFNRPAHVKMAIESLLSNKEAASSDLIVFVDGPRPDKEGENDKVEEVRRIVSKIKGFRSLECHYAERNKGLGPSVIYGVTDVINRYGRAIVIEDDLVVMDNFLSYINQALDYYEDKPGVFSVCGYTNKVSAPKEYGFDAFFSTRSSSLGWATWKDRWNSCDWAMNDWGEVRRNACKFNRWGGSDCYKMLNDWKKGRNKSWAIRFCYNEFIQGKVSLFPLKSHLIAGGFDGTGTNSKKWSRFESDLDESGTKEFRWPDSIQINAFFKRRQMKYNSLIKRFYSKLMYWIHK